MLTLQIRKVEIETLGMDQQARFPMFEYCSELFCKSLPFRVWLVIYISLMSAKTHEREKCLRHCSDCDCSTACTTAWLDEEYFSS